MSKLDHPVAIQELPIRRRSIDSEHAIQEDEIVSCPLREGAMTPDDCGHCGRCESVVYGNDGRNFVRCELPPDLVPSPAQAAKAAGADGTPVTSLMSDEVVCVRPDLSVDTLAALLAARQISGAPVIDADGRVIGVVSKSDIVEVYARHADLVVEDIMMSVAFTLDEHATIAQAAAMMAIEGVHRVPIVTRGGDVLGIVSALDILRWMAGQHGYAPASRHADC